MLILDHISEPFRRSIESSSAATSRGGRCDVRLKEGIQELKKLFYLNVVLYKSCYEYVNSMKYICFVIFIRLLTTTFFAFVL